jgi:hypothetical protein
MAFPLLGILEFYVPIRQKYSVLYLSQKKFKITAGLKNAFLINIRLLANLLTQPTQFQMTQKQNTN